MAVACWLMDFRTVQLAFRVSNTNPVLISLLISALLQVVLFSAVPFVVYAIPRRTVRGFPAHTGLTRPTNGSLLLGVLAGALFTGVMLTLFMTAPDLRDLATGPNTVPGKLRPLGPSAAGVAALLIAAMIQTALAEEIFFRGFLAKRLITSLGFAWGNALQATGFGATHLLLFAGPGGATFSPARAAMVVGATGLIGGLLCWINERRANGSIFPGWLAHGVANVISYAVLAFGA
jgi:membrane protease YdiL (CAAX protease family)